MKPSNRAVLAFALGLALVASVGCGGNIALAGRPTLQLDQDEIFAEIVRVDTLSREIHLRPDDGRNRLVGYSGPPRRESRLINLFTTVQYWTAAPVDSAYLF